MRGEEDGFSSHNILMWPFIDYFCVKMEDVIMPLDSSFIIYACNQLLLEYIHLSLSGKKNIKRCKLVFTSNSQVPLTMLSLDHEGDQMRPPQSFHCFVI